MKIATYIFLFLIVLYSDFSFEKKDHGKLIIEISGFDNNKGKLWLAGFSDSSFWGKGHENAKFKIQTEIADQKVNLTIDSLPFGIYGVECFQDENMNQKIDRNMFGKPTEKFGFSLNPVPKFKMPEWNEVKFQFDSDSLNLSIKLQN